MASGAQLSCPAPAAATAAAADACSMVAAARALRPLLLCFGHEAALSLHAHWAVALKPLCCCNDAPQGLIPFWQPRRLRGGTKCRRHVLLANPSLSPKQTVLLSTFKHGIEATKHTGCWESFICLRSDCCNCIETI